MSKAQREQLTAILEDIYEGFTEGIAQSIKGKTPQEVRVFSIVSTCICSGRNVCIKCLHSHSIREP